VVAECDPRQFYGGLQRSRGGISVRDLTRLGVTTKQAAVAEATGCGGSGGLAAGASAGIEPGASGTSSRPHRRIVSAANCTISQMPYFDHAPLA